ncbi:MAG: FAD-dependent oxidoreductase [Gemmatimonadaceae bacterium]|jgi:hypothetical protein|nr:FAD-dependent oxidoreductase [Gemmatimonadaceae bacterium]
MSSRRDVLRALIGSPLWLATAGRTQWSQHDDAVADVVIVGGGLGGCAAALAAAEHGLRVILTEETAWIGGQLTAQAVPPDENAWIETIGGTRRYRALRDGVRTWYREHAPLTTAARANARLNPGRGWVSRLCAEPRVWLTVLHAQYAPHIASGRLRILHHTRAVAADVTGDRVRAVSVRTRGAPRDTVLRAPYFIDATELGDLLPLTGTEFVTGAESRRETGEAHAPEVAQPDNVQSFTVCFAMEHRPGESHVIDRPAEYATWRDCIPDPPSGPRLLSLDDETSRRIGFDPVARTGYWSYRRIIDRELFAPGAYASDVTLVNWGQNDYAFGSLLGDATSAAHHLTRAGALSRSLLYWLQTECPRADGGVGWPGLRLRPDIVGTEDGLSMAPYVREARRIRAVATIREEDVTVEGRMRETGASRAQVTARVWPDSIGIGHYHLDLHRSTRGDASAYAETLPFQIPLGALVPQRVVNLLPAAKNIGTTHRSNGCHRLHPIEWAIGESVGVLVAQCIAQRTTPHAVHASRARTATLQGALATDGVPIAWPAPMPPGA